MKNLPLNLLYKSQEGYLVTSPHLRLNQNIMGIVVENVCYGFEEYQMPWLMARRHAAENPLYGIPAIMAAPEEIRQLLQNREAFNLTVEILKRYGIECKRLNGKIYWTGQPDWCDCYFAIKNGSLEQSSYSGQTKLFYRPAVRLIAIA